jgi:tetratricopeptide (TPR) repeat protein
VIEICEAVGDRRTAGLTRNVLGLVARDQGRLDEACRLCEAALATAQEIGAETEMAYARHDLGMLYLDLGRPAAAIPLLEAARQSWDDQGHNLYRLKSEAYLGLAWLACGEQSRASQCADQGRDAFRDDVPGGEQPQAWLWALHRLLDGLGRVEEAGTVLQAAYDELQRQAQVFGDDEKRRSFLERAPLNRSIVCAHGKMTDTNRYVTVQLAREDTPLGRTLTDADRVSVRWTVQAPQDETISGKTARRHHVLQRLLEEAAAQGAAPTDAELARVLGVSRRTILRDMAMLAQAGAAITTRARR